MKLKLHPYSKNFSKLFEKERRLITKVFERLGNFEIHHVGSTAVPGMMGKGIIDIVIAIEDWKKGNNYIRALKTIGFKHVHPEEKGRIFLSRIRQTKYGDTHLHLVKQKSKDLKELVSFRDLLRRNEKAAKRYIELKREWMRRANNDRKLFGSLKARSLKRNSVKSMIGLMRKRKNN